MPADGGGFFGRGKERPSKNKAPEESSYEEKNFDRLALRYLEDRLKEPLSSEQKRKLEAHLRSIGREQKENAMEAFKAKSKLSIIGDLVDSFESAAVPEPAKSAKPEKPAKKAAAEKTGSPWTPAEAKAQAKQDHRELAAAVEKHVRPERKEKGVQGRLLSLTEQLRKAKKIQEREVIITQIEALVSDNPDALERALAGVQGAAQVSMIGERLAARAVSDEEKISLIQQITELADSAKRDKRLSDQDVIRLVSARIERSLATNDTGLISKLDAGELTSALNEGALLTTGTAVRGVELMTLGAYISLIAQAVMQTTIVYTSPAGIAFNVACVAAAAGVLPVTELAKALNFHEKAARRVFYEELARPEETEELDENGKPIKKKKKRNVSARAVAAALMATGAGVATEVATNIAPKILTVAAAQGPNMLSTAAALRQGHEAGSFVDKTDAALAQASEQVSQVLREPRIEGQVSTEALPPMVSRYHTTLEAFGDHMIRNELGGGRSEASGGTGVAGVGPSALRKIALFEGWFPGNYVQHDDPRVRALGPSAQAWAFEQRQNFSHVQLDENGEPVVLRNEEGQPLLDASGEEQYARVPIEFLTRSDGSQESIPDWVERRYEEFETKAQDHLVSFAQQREDLGELSAYLADRLVPLNVKIDLMRARIQGTDGFTQDTEELLETLLEIEDMFRTEFTIPVQGLNESLVASLRQVGSGDEGVRIDAPELEMNLSLLENLEAPHSLTLDDLVNPEQVARLFMERNLSGQLLFALLFGGIFFQQFWQFNAGKGRARKHARVLGPRMKKMFGERYQEGDEYQIASSISGDVGETLKAFLAGDASGVLNAGPIKELIPFETKGSWLALDPEFVLFSMRLAGERSGEFPVSTSANPLTWLQSMGSAYKKGMSEFIHGATTLPEVKTYMNLEERYRDRKVLTGEIFGEMLPGFTDVVFLSRKIHELRRQGRTEADPQVQELSTQFKNAYTEMVFSHLTARARYTRTKIDYYRSAYEELRTRGSFEDVSVERLTNLPNLTIPFGGTTVKLAEDDIAKLEAVRKTGLRTTVIAEIERELKREEAMLDSIDRFVDDVEKNENNRIASTSTSFAERLNTLKKTLDRTKPVEILGDRLLADMSARGGLNRMIREQLQEEIKVQVREHNAREAEAGPKKERAYPIQKQYEAINETLQYTVHDSPGEEHSLFINDRILNRFTCRPTLVYRPRGHKGAIAEYYAIEFLVTERDKEDPVFVQDLPIQTLFAEGLSPQDAAKQVQDWVASMRNKASMAAKLYALDTDISKKREDINLPETINLSSSDAKSRLDTLFGTLIPKGRIQNDLSEIDQVIERVEKRVGQLGDLTNLRRAKSRKEKEARKRQRTRQKHTYQDLFATLREEERNLANVERERQNLKPAFPEENRRVKTLVDFLANPDNRRMLSQAKVSFEYLPDIATRNNNIRLTDRRVAANFGGRTRTKVVEMNLDDVLNTIMNPSLRTDAQRKKALLDLFTEGGRPAETLRGNNRSGKRSGA